MLRREKVLRPGRRILCLIMRATTDNPSPSGGMVELRRSRGHSLGIQGEDDVGDVTHRLVYPIDVADRAS
jgi:hypothetical protein